MESTESKTTGLFWEVYPNSSKWLAENLKEMDQSVKRMLKLIEEDGSDACQRKPELMSNVEEFHQLYRSLAERYDHVTREPCKNGSGESESGYGQELSPQTPDVKVDVTKSSDPSAGVDTSPSSPGADSVFSLKEGSESASLSSSSDSDSESFVTSYLRTPLSINSQSLHQKMADLETELSAVKDRLQMRETDLELERERALELQRRVVELEACVVDVEAKRGMLGEEIAKLKQDLVCMKSKGNLLQNQLVMAQEGIAKYEAQLGSEKEHVLELEEMIARYNADLSDRDLEVWELKVAFRDAEELFSQEKANMQSDALILSETQAQLVVELKESESETKELKEKAMALEDEHMKMLRFYEAQVTALHDESNELKEHMKVLKSDFDRCSMNCDALIEERETLDTNLSARDNHIREMETYMSQIIEQNEDLIVQSRRYQELVNELNPKVEALQNEVDRQRGVISDGAEEKKEVIRQLCFALEHYRSGYKELCQAFVGKRRCNVVSAA